MGKNHKILALTATRAMPGEKHLKVVEIIR